MIGMNKEDVKLVRFVGVLVCTLLFFLLMSYLELSWQLYLVLTLVCFGLLSFYYLRIDNCVGE